MTANLGLGLWSVQNRTQAEPYALPAVMPIPLLWFNPAKAGDGASLTDFGSLGIDATQPTLTSQPSTTNEINGRPTLSFDGIDDFLTTANADLTPYQAITVMVVSDKNDTDQGVIVEQNTNYGLGNNFLLFQSSNVASSNSYHLHGTSFASLETSMGFAGPSINVVTFDSNGSGTSAEVQPRRNGAIPALTQLNGGTSSANFFDSDPLYLGSRAGGTFFAAMDLAELIIFPGTLSAAQIEAYEASRGSLYGIALG